MIALREWQWPWPLAVLATGLFVMCLGLFNGLFIAKVRMQPFIVTLCGLLFFRGLSRFIAHDDTKGFGTEGFETLRRLTVGSVGPIPDAVRGPGGHRVADVRAAAPLGVRTLPLCGGPQRGGRAVLGHRHAGGHHRSIRHQRSAGGDLGAAVRVLHELDLARGARFVLRALRHRGGGARRMQPAGRGGVDPRDRDRHGAITGAAQPDHAP